MIDPEATITGRPDEPEEFNLDSTFIPPQPQPQPQPQAQAQAQAQKPVSVDATLIGPATPETGDSESEDLAAEACTVVRPGPPSAPAVSQNSGGTRGVQGISLSSQIWMARGDVAFDELVTIRRRPVSGEGPFGITEDADFEVVEKLAEGGMGVVYVARQRSLNRELAIKTLKPQSGTGSTQTSGGSAGKQKTRAELQRREMFLSEALVTANLVHPNIIPIHDLAETADGIPYYAMKRVHGIPWNRQIRTMTLGENLEVLHKVCDAVAYAHHHGVINRDLKPENIMLGEFGEVLVLDWGLAVPAPHAADPNFRSPVASFGAGTPAYMSPELWTGPPELIGEWSDIYLLGAILFEIVTGLPPHEFPDAKSLRTTGDFWKSLDEVLRANIIRKTEGSGELFEIACRAIRTKPEDRHGSVLEFQFSVRNFQRHEESRRLSQRAEELISSVPQTGSDYSVYQTAVALHEEAIRVWPRNSVAASGLRSARLQYAELARRKGDFDLGLQITRLETGSEFAELSRRLKAARQIRSGIKWTALSAVIAVVLLGAKSIYDNGIIIDLNTQVAARRADAANAIAQADAAVESAKQAAVDAELARVEAGDATAKATAALREASVAEAAAIQARSDTEAAISEAKLAAKEASASRELAVTATKQAEQAELRTEQAVARQQAAEVAAHVAEVEIQFQEIRGLTLNENYSDAVRAIDRTVNSEALKQLPEELRLERTSELEAQKAQLLKRTRQEKSPTQAQAVSPDLELLALGDQAGNVNVMVNPAKGGEWTESHRNLVLDVPATELVFLDQRTLLICSGTQLLKWNIDLEPSELLFDFTERIVAMDMVGERTIVGGVDGRVGVLESASGRVLCELKLLSEVKDVALLPDTDMFLTAASRGGQSSDILAWRLPDSAEPDQQAQRLGQLRLPRDTNFPPLKLSISPDSNHLVISNSHNGELLFLSRQDSESVEGSGGASRPGSDKFPFQHPSAAAQAEESQNSDNSRHIVKTHRRPVNSLAWNHDSTKLVTGSDDRSVIVWSLNDGGLAVDKTLNGHGSSVQQVVFLDKPGRYVASGSSDQSSRLWDLEQFDEDRRKIRDAFHLTLMLPEDTGLEDEQSDEVQYRILNADRSVHRGAIQSVEFSRDGSTLATAAVDGTVALWDSVSGAVVLNDRYDALPTELFSEGHRFNIAGLKYVRGRKPLLLTTGYDGTLRIWELSTSPTANVQKMVLDDLGLVHAFAISRTGEWLVTSSSDESSDEYFCNLWSVAELLEATRLDRLPPKRLQGLHSADITAIAISDDGERVVTGGRDGVIGVWSRTSQSLIAVGRQHRPKTIVTSVHFLPDGSILSAGLDGQAIHWKVDSPVETLPAGPRPVLIPVNRLKTRQLPIDQMIVHPDGNRLLLISADSGRNQMPKWYLDEHSLDASDETREIRLPRLQDGAATRILSADWNSAGSQLLVSTGSHLLFLNCETWETTRVMTGPNLKEASASFAATALTGDAMAESDLAELDDSIITFDGNTTRVWDLNHGRQIESLEGPSVIQDIGFSQDESHRYLVVCGSHTRVFQSDSADAGFGKVISRLQHDLQDRPLRVAFSVSAPSVCVVARRSGTIEMLQFGGDDTVHSICELGSLHGPVTDLQWSAETSRMLAVTGSGELFVAETNLAEPDKQLSVRTTLPELLAASGLPVDSTTGVRLSCGAITADGRMIFVGGMRAETEESIGWVIQVDSDAQQTLSCSLSCIVRGHSAGGILAADFIQNSPWLITGGYDGRIYAWNWRHPLQGAEPLAYEAWQLLRSDAQTAHLAPVQSLRANQSGMIGSAGADGTVILWKSPVRR